jgi:transketolase
MNYEATLQELVLADDKYMVMTAENRAAIRHLPGVLNGRFLDTGITEQTMIGMAAGLALRGRVPIAHALAAFLTMRAFEFVRTDVGIGQLPVKLVGGVPGFLSDGNGPTHQAIEDISLMRGIPGMQIFCPADEAELVLGMPSFLASPHPVYIRHNALPAAIEHDPHFAIGQAELVQDGRDVTILVYGMLFREALAASELLAAQGISVRLLNLRTVWPVDETAVLAAAHQTKLLVTIEDHFLTGGLFSIVSELLVRRGVRANVLPIALENRWFQPALLDDVLAYEGFTGPQLAEKIEEYLARDERGYS